MSFRISVVIPTHRRAALLERTLQSLIAQTYPAELFDIHVVQNVDDPETDALMARLVSSSPVLLRHSHRPSDGPAPSRQYGAETAQGDLIAFIDDDCQATQEWLTEAARPFEEPSVGLVQGTTLPNPDQPRHYFEKTVQVTEPSIFFETCNIVYRREAFIEAGGFGGVFAERFYGEDTDLGWRTKRAGWTAKFAKNAVVHHEVFDQPLVKWLMEAWHLRNLPLLVREWPDMRQHMFARYFLHRQSATFVLFVLGVLLIPLFGAPSIGLTLPYVAVRTVERGRFANPVKVAARIVLGLPRATITLIALIFGSIRHRSFLL